MFLVIAIPFITVTGATIFPYTLRLPLIYTVGILFAVVFVLTDITLQFNAVSGTAFILLSYICISIAYSYDPASTLNLFCCTCVHSHYCSLISRAAIIKNIYDNICYLLGYCLFNFDKCSYRQLYVKIFLVYCKSKPFGTGSTNDSK